MGDLKKGWKRVKFGEVVQLGKERCTNPAADGITRYIGLEHLEPGDLRIRSWGDIAEGTTFTTRVRPGKVLFGKRRAYQRKVAVADFDAVCSGDIYVFESIDSKRLLPELLPFLCQTDAFFDHAVGTSAGSLSPRTNWTSLAEYEFALPPLEEQRRLAQALSCAREAVDASEEVLAQLGPLVDRFIDAALEGNLAGVPPDLSADLHPTAWRSCVLGDLCSLSNGNGFRPSDWSDRGMPIIRIQNVRGSTTFNYYAGTPDPKWIVEPGELLFAWAGVPGVSFGPGLWSGQRGVLNQHIYRVTPKAGVDRQWLYELLRYLTPRIERRAHGFKHNLLHIRQTEFTQQIVTLPRLAEQVKIVSAVTQFRAWIAAVEARCSSSRAIQISMMRNMEAP